MGDAAAVFMMILMSVSGFVIMMLIFKGLWVWIISDAIVAAHRKIREQRRPPQPPAGPAKPKPPLQPLYDLRLVSRGPKKEPPPPPPPGEKVCSYP